VDIVSAEPTTATGQKAYKRLQQIGFSEEVEAPAPAVKAEITVSPAPPPEAPSNAQANNLSEPAVRQSHNTGTASQGSPVQAAVKVQSAGKAQVSGNPTPKVSAPAMSRTMSAPKKTLGTKKSTGGINKTVAVSKTKLRIATSTKANKSTHVSNNHAQAQSVWISGTPGGAH
jgi:hypothetical protein